MTTPAAIHNVVSPSNVGLQCDVAKLDTKDWSCAWAQLNGPYLDPEVGLRWLGQNWILRIDHVHGLNGMGHSISMSWWCVKYSHSYMLQTWIKDREKKELIKIQEMQDFAMLIIKIHKWKWTFYNPVITAHFNRGWRPPQHNQWKLEVAHLWQNFAGGLSTMVPSTPSRSRTIMCSHAPPGPIPRSVNASQRPISVRGEGPHSKMSEIW